MFGVNVTSSMGEHAKTWSAHVRLESGSAVDDELTKLKGKKARRPAQLSQPPSRIHEALPEPSEGKSSGAGSGSAIDSELEAMRKKLKARALSLNCQRQAACLCLARVTERRTVPLQAANSHFVHFDMRTWHRRLRTELSTFKLFYTVDRLTHGFQNHMSPEDSGRTLQQLAL